MENIILTHKTIQKEQDSNNLGETPAAENFQRGAGLTYKNKHYITHTTLPSSLSAVQTFSKSQRLAIAAFFLTLIVGFVLNPLLTLQVVIAMVSIFYFIDTLFNLILTTRSLRKVNELQASANELRALSDAKLPVYTILCPLYKEAHVIPQFVEAIAQLDWPKEKLDVMLLLEEDDKESIEIVSQMNLPFYFRTVVVPDSQPKTKPKACNYGLSYARGEYLVIFDAEDIPDPLQLKKAYLGFQKVPKKVVCLQAKLNYYNSRQNFLTRFFTAEYSLWFDLTLTGLQSFRSSLPLGGTSNHFRTQVLRDLQGWDPFNVTEDADLGIRLFKRGFQTEVIDSTTYEEATSKMKNWIRQRSRWIKGYMQTYLVHMRTWRTFVKEQGVSHYFIFQLTVGGKLLFLLLNPLMWIITLGYFVAFPFFGPTIEIIYQPPISYIAVFSWVFGNFLFLYYYMLGCAKRNQWDLMKYVFMMPFYWAMMSTAAMMALYQLIVKPHYWEKTLHGFHLGPTAPTPQSAVSPVGVPAVATAPSVMPAVKSAPSYAAIVAGFKPQLRKNGLSRDFNKVLKVLNVNRFNFSLLQPVAIILLLSFDFVLARLILEPSDANTYFLLSLTCKVIVILAQGMAYVANEIFSKHKKPVDRFYDLLFSTFLAQWLAFIALGFEGRTTVPYLFGDKFNAILPYMAFYLFAGMCFAIATVFSNYHVKKKRYAFTVISLFIAFLQGALLFFAHGNIKEMVSIIAYLSAVNVIVMIILHVNKHYIEIIENNASSLLSMLSLPSAGKAWQQKRMRILIFNWRDTKHVYAGGAEVYIQELAKRWVKDGNKVTIFCGNDNHSAQNETVNGVEIVRRGGTYTVYIFAFLYYFLKFRGKYDVIIDCENGIPFFAPLFTRRPVILLIHHVHQAIFREYLQFPLKQFAAFLEGKLMPMVYRNKVIITVSESSKHAIVDLGFTKEGNIEVIYNGVITPVIAPTPKTSYPSFLYLGRLKEYKNIDVAIKAFSEVLKEQPNAKFSIVGSGEYERNLKSLVERLGISESVSFMGRVTESQKAILFAQSWAMLQPSQIEGWGITVIEANALGTPVIASQVNGLRDSVVDGKTGMLVPVRNIEQFALAMKKIAQDYGYRNMLSQNAYIWAQNFDWDKSANHFYNLIGRSVDATTASLYSKLSFARSKE
jgi:glycosyltransferase XagB